MSATILLTGNPGSGKDTQAKRIRDEYGFEMVDVGSTLNENREYLLDTETLDMVTPEELGDGWSYDVSEDGFAIVEDDAAYGHDEDYMTQGQLLDGGNGPSAETVAYFLRNELGAADTVIAGYPRTEEQAYQVLDMDVDALLWLDVDRDEMYRRITGRRVCDNAGCDGIYHLDFNPPNETGVCDIDGGVLVQRADDTADGLKEREGWQSLGLARMNYVFGKEDPAFDWVRIDANQAIEPVWEDVRGAIEPYVGEDAA